MKHSVRHFSVKEFNCPCCGRVKVAVALVFWLDVFRRALGHPLRVNSGFRCASRNAGVGGSSTSRHLIGCAADLSIPEGVERDAFFQMARRLSGEGWEIKEYPTFLHIAVPREKQIKVWDGGEVVTL